MFHTLTSFLNAEKGLSWDDLKLLHLVRFGKSFLHTYTYIDMYIYLIGNTPHRFTWIWFTRNLYFLQIILIIFSLFEPNDQSYFEFEPYILKTILLKINCTQKRWARLLDRVNRGSSVYMFVYIFLNLEDFNHWTIYM